MPDEIIHMVLRQVPLNISQTEGAANTLKAELVEVPSAQNAKAVRIAHCVIELQVPEGIAATLTENNGGILVGDQKAAVVAAAAFNMATPGAVAGFGTIQYGLYAAMMLIQPGVREFFPNADVPRSPDGKYYITIANKGANNVAAKYIRIRAEFSVDS
jgi:hypothetical protein